MLNSVSEDGGGFQRGRRQGPPKGGTPNVDRLPPHATEAEQGVLGCLLWAPNECMPDCVAKLGARCEGSGVRGESIDSAFYDLRHQAIYNAIVGMYDKREAIDMITLSQRLKDAQMLEQVGGLTYLSSLQDAVPSAANLSFYLEIVVAKATLRKMIRTCSDIVARAYDHEGEVDALMDQAETEILRIAEQRDVASTLSIKELVNQAIVTIEDFHQRQGALSGLATGFPDFDRMTNGLNGGEMIVIAARPSLGKTSIAMNIAEYVAVEHEWVEETEDAAYAQKCRERGLTVVEVV